MRNAYHRGYYVVVPRQCVGSDAAKEHQCSLKNIDRYFGEVVDLKTIFAIWRKSK